MDASTQALAARAMGRDRSAFAELYERFYPKLARFLEGKLAGSHADVEEVVQDAFMKAWQSIERYDARHRFSTWLYAIAWRTALDRQQRRRQLPLGIVHQVLDSRPPVERVAELHEQLNNVWAEARSLLGSDQFSVLWLRYAEDLSPKEIARVMKRSTVSIRVTLHRARGKLRSRLNAGAPPESATG